MLSVCVMCRCLMVLMLGSSSVDIWVCFSFGIMVFRYVLLVCVGNL